MRTQEGRHKGRCRRAVGPGLIEQATVEGEHDDEVGERDEVSEEGVMAATATTDATYAQRQRQVATGSGGGAVSDGGVVHVHGGSQMHADTAGVHETAGGGGCGRKEEVGVEEITEAEYMRGIKRKRDPG